MEGGDTGCRLTFLDLFKLVGRGAGLLGMIFRGGAAGRTRGRGRDLGDLAATLRTAALRVSRLANLFKLVPGRTTFRTTRREGRGDDLRTVFLAVALRTGRRPFLIIPGIKSFIPNHDSNFNLSMISYHHSGHNFNDPRGHHNIGQPRSNIQIPHLASVSLDKTTARRHRRTHEHVESAVGFSSVLNHHQ